MKRTVTVTLKIDDEIKTWSDTYDFSNSVIQCRDEQEHYIKTDVKGVFKEVDIVSIDIR